MNIILSNNNINNLKTLLSFVPDTFNHVPLKIYKDENGESFAKIDTSDVNGDVTFYGRVKLDNIKEIENNTMLAIRLQTNKSVLGTLFNTIYDSVELNKNRILVQNKNKKMSIQLYQLLDKDIYDLPEINIDMYKAVLDNNPGLNDDGYAVINFNNENIKDFIDSTNILSPNKIEDLRFKFKTNKNKIVASSEDYIKNSFEYVFEECIPPKFNLNTCFDYNLIEIMRKIFKFKDYTISFLVSNPVISFTIYDNNGTIVTISVPAQKD